MQVNDKEYMALLSLKTMVEVVTKLWTEGREFATPESINVLFMALASEVARIPNSSIGMTEEPLRKRAEA